ncbi:MAG TPA: protein phosphatase 2C domain-containing protein [Gammaproteobacteria bacterium]|nr:protein phosphatase 2C domain-containing protein [Gammaproteobacteria bacterium]
MQIESAELTLLGDREQNQDRATIAIDDEVAFLVVADGMGGHAEGERAAETASKSMLDQFWQSARPILDPQGFLQIAVARAHDDVVRLGAGRALDARPRATCAACVVQNGTAHWAHVGDSRVYLIRDGAVHERTRDHSHVEVLLQEGLITEDEVSGHPMRNFVECCLGGDAALPEMSVTNSRKLSVGDVLVLCTDGFWSGLDETGIASLHSAPDDELAGALQALGERAVKVSAPYSDNTTAVALRWQG